MMKLPCYTNKFSLLSSRFSKAQLNRYIVPHRPSQELIYMIFDMERPTAFLYSDIKEDDKNLSILQISGFSGVGKLYLMYELAPMSLEKLTVFRVSFLGCAGVLQRVLFKQLTNLVYYSNKC